MVNRSAQGSLEYLLMIGAAVLIVAVVIIAMSGLIVDTKDQNSTSDYNAQMEILNNLKKDNQPNKSTGPFISSFSVDGVDGIISGSTINLILPFNSTINLSSVDPLIISKLGVVSPSGLQKFSNGPVTYIVTDINGKSKSYVVTITKEQLEIISDKNILEIYFYDVGLEQVVNISHNNSTKLIYCFFALWQLFEFESIFYYF